MKQVADILGENRVLLAPMAGVTDAPFRGLCRQMGAGLTYTEMVSAKGLHFNPDSRVSKALLTFSPHETPCAVQIFGSEPEMMAEQAAGIVARHTESVALVDINMGCPVTKVVAKGEGSALMCDVRKAAAIVSAVAGAVSVPVTVKFRSGWDEASSNAVEFALAMQQAGAAAVAVHGRTREQFYRGQADWDIIAAVKAAVAVPVIGSGDVLDADSVVAMLGHTGVDAVMVARGAQGNPWVFRQAAELLGGAASPSQPSFAERIDVALEHSAEMRSFAGDRSVGRMRKHVAWYVAGMPAATRVRDRVNAALSYDELDALLAEYREYVVAREHGHDGRS